MALVMAKPRLARCAPGRSVACVLPQGWDVQEPPEARPPRRSSSIWWRRSRETNPPHHRALRRPPGGPGAPLPHAVAGAIRRLSARAQGVGARTYSASLPASARSRAAGLRQLLRQGL
jgi:hypothetical protein